MTIDVLKEMLNELQYGNEDGRGQILIDASDENIAALTEAIERLEWIPVTPETMPTEPYGCLVIVEEDDYYGEPHQVIYPGFVGYDGDEWNDGAGEQIPFEVTHWQKLPGLPTPPDSVKE